MHVDTDEPLVIKPMLRQQQRAALAVPSANQPSLITRLARPCHRDPCPVSLQEGHLPLPRLSMPRILFGSVERSGDVPRGPPGFNATRLETLRWKCHAAFNDTERNAQPKVIVDVSRVARTDEMFKVKPFSIQRPSKELCRRIDQMNISTPQWFPLVVNHCVGTWVAIALGMTPVGLLERITSKPTSKKEETIGSLHG